VSSDDSGYVHQPGEFGDDPAGADDDAVETAGSDPQGFGARGWVLVGVLAVCTLVIPGIIYLRPGILSAVGIPYIASLLVLPLAPAVALGFTAVWAMTAATGEE
jgi:hypothetical protein